MFVPNNTGLLARVSGTNAYGEKEYGKPLRVRCAVVNLEGIVAKSAVRADSSASRGAADEVQSVANIMFPANVLPKLGDKFTIAGRVLRFIMVAPRYAVTGRLDHYECEFESYPS